MGTFHSSLSSPYPHADSPPAHADPHYQTPLALRARVATAMIVLMLATAAGIEVAYAAAQRMNGFGVETLDKFGSPQFLGVSPSLDQTLST